MEGSRVESLRIGLKLQINDLTVTGEWTPRGGLIWNGVPADHLQGDFPDASLVFSMCPDDVEQLYWPFVADCNEALTALIERVLNS